MSSEQPTGGGFLEQLPVRRNAAVSALLGVTVAAVVYAGRVLEVFGPAPDQGSPLLFLSLAVVLASTLAGLVFSILTAVSAYRVLTAGPPEVPE